MINPDTILPEEFSPDTNIEQLLEICYDKEVLVCKVFEYYALAMKPWLDAGGFLTYAIDAECENTHGGNHHISIKFVDEYDDVVWVALDYERRDDGYKPFISCMGASDYDEDEISEHLCPISETAKDVLKKHYTAFYPEAPEGSTYFIAECSPNNVFKAFEKALGIIEVQMMMDAEREAEEENTD